jgi:transketolase
VKRFESYGWRAENIDGHNQAAVLAAIRRAQASDKPSLIACKTTIGFGLPTRAGTAKAHGEAPGAEEVAGARKNLNWPSPPFVIPDDILAEWRKAGQAGVGAHQAWRERLAAADPAKRAEFERRLSGKLPPGFDAAIKDYKKKLASDGKEIATRKASEAALNIIAPAVPELITGSADLTGSNNNKVDATPAISPGHYAGRFVHWGIREHGMAAAVNGMSLHKGFIPSGATFLIFTDYCRPSLRLAALMGIRIIHVMTHDSIGLGEDGPTHQPVEQLASLRAIPNMQVFRPADQTETVECWQLALESETAPSILALTRQNLPQVRTTFTEANLCARGAYELRAAPGRPIGKGDVSIFASGSEVSIAIETQKLLAEKDVAARVVSVPCMDLFEQQSDDYRSQLIGDAPINMAIEAAVRQGWDSIIGRKGLFIGMKTFGASGPYKDVYEHFGITPQAAVEAVLARRKSA